MSIHTLDIAPKPGAAPLAAMVGSRARFEIQLMLRNGEQLLLTLIIPIGLLLGLSSVNWIDLGPGPRVNVVTPGILALAVMSTSFTSQAISVGFDRRYGVLKLLGSSPLPRIGLLVSKTLAVICIEAIQVTAICVVAFAIGWQPQGNPLAVLVLLIAGTAAFSSLGIALAGVVRAETTLALANAIYLLLLFVGGTIIPRDRMPDWLGTLGQLLPSGALGDGLRTVMLTGSTLPWPALVVLAGWFVIGAVIAAKTFRWE